MPFSLVSKSLNMSFLVQCTGFSQHTRLCNNILLTAARCHIWILFIQLESGRTIPPFIWSQFWKPFSSSNIKYVCISGGTHQSNERLEKVHHGEDEGVHHRTKEGSRDGKTSNARKSFKILWNSTYLQCCHYCKGLARTVSNANTYLRVK